MKAGSGLRIALLITRFPPLHLGAAELQAARLARELAPRHDVIVFTRGGPGTSRIESIDGYTVVRRKVLEFAGPLRIVSDIAAGRYSLARHGGAADIVVAYQLVTAGYLAHLFKKRTGIPYVVSIRGEGEYRNYSGPRKRLVPPVLRTADRILLQSPLLLDDFSKECGEFMDPGLVLPRCGYLSNGVDRVGRRAREGKNVTFLGRLVPDKNPAAIIEAARHLGERDPPVRISWVVVGDGPEKHRLRKTASDLKLPVSFAGTVPPEKLAGYIRSSLCLVLPSRFGEGIPNVVLEAMAHGVPCVATDTGGTSELVRNNETGILVDRDDAAGLAEGILRLVTDDGLHERLANECLRSVEPYYWENVIGGYESLFEEVVRKARSERK